MANAGIPTEFEQRAGPLERGETFGVWPQGAQEGEGRGASAVRAALDRAKLTPTQRRVAVVLFASADKDGRVYVRSTAVLGRSVIGEGGRPIRSDKARAALRALVEAHVVVVEGSGWFLVQPEADFWRVEMGPAPSACGLRPGDAPKEDDLLLPRDKTLDVALCETANAGYRDRSGADARPDIPWSMEDVEAVREVPAVAARPATKAEQFAEEWRCWLRPEVLRLVPAATEWDLNSWRKHPAALRYALAEMRVKVAEEANGGEVIRHRGKLLNAIFHAKRREGRK